MEHWTSFIYLYGVGGILFFFALFFGVKKGVLKLNRRFDKRFFWAAIGVYLIYFSSQLIWNILAIASK